MAKVNPNNDKYELGGSKDTELEGIDAGSYDVFTDEEKLASARKDYPKYDWFASYTITDKSGNPVKSLPEYKLKFDKPDSGNLYYYLNGETHQVTYSDTDNKGNKKRVKANMTVGDPPVSIGG